MLIGMRRHREGACVHPPIINSYCLPGIALAVKQPNTVLAIGIHFAGQEDLLDGSPLSEEKELREEGAVRYLVE